jgi:uncharacterized membrane protein
MFFPQSAAQWHAALNDFPSLLFIVAFGFEIAAAITKRESLRAVAFWSLMVGAAGGLLALVSGLRAEDTIDHGGSVHLVMARHETLAIAVTVLFVALAGWQLWHRAGMTTGERRAFRMLSGLGVVLVLWTAHLGGAMVYEFGGGVPTEVMQGALTERERGHTHEQGTDPSSGDSATAEHAHD